MSLAVARVRIRPCVALPHLGTHICVKEQMPMLLFGHCRLKHVFNRQNPIGPTYGGHMPFALGVSPAQ